MVNYHNELTINGVFYFLLVDMMSCIKFQLVISKLYDTD